MIISRTVQSFRGIFERLLEADGSQPAVCWKDRKLVWTTQIVKRNSKAETLCVEPSGRIPMLVTDSDTNCQVCFDEFELAKLAKNIKTRQISVCENSMASTSRIVNDHD